MFSRRDRPARLALVLTLLAVLIGYVAFALPSSFAQTVCTSAVYDGMEITQAIQYFGHGAPLDNSVEMIPRKGTTVRVYMKAQPDGCSGTVPNVRGFLQFGLSQSSTRTIWVPDNLAIDVLGSDSNQDRRADEQKTLNYTFVTPPLDSPGPSTLWVRFKQWGSEQQWQDWESAQFRDDLCGYDLGGAIADFVGIRPAISGIREGEVDDMFFSMWPMPAPRGKYGGGGGSGLSSYTLFEELVLYYDMLVDNDMYARGLYELEIYRDALNVDMLVSWVSQAVPRLSLDPPAFAKLKGVSCAASRDEAGDKLCNTSILRDGAAFYKGTLAHEAGHNIFFQANEWHGTAKPIAPESGWDVGNPDGYLGLGNLKDPSTELYDIPEAGWDTAERWISPDTYTAAMDVLASHCATDVVADIFTIPVDAELASIEDHVFHHTRTGPPITSGKTGTAELRLLDNQDQLLYATKFDGHDLHSDDGGPPDGPGITVVRAPYNAAVNSIELYKNGISQERRTRTANSPAITIALPTSGSILTDTLTVEWQVTDADSDPIETDVLYSKDGVDWYPLVLRTTATTVSVGTGQLASSDNAKIRVRSSDGFNTTREDVADLHLGPNRPPRVWISHPDDPSTFYAGSNVMLLGGASDLEDVSIPETSVAWYSSIDGLIATGYDYNTTSLSTGTHVLEFRATDSDGGVSSAYATVEVLP